MFIELWKLEPWEINNKIIIIMFCGLLLAGEKGDGITLNHTLHKSYIILAVEYFFLCRKICPTSATGLHTNKMEQTQSGLAQAQHR